MASIFLSVFGSESTAYWCFSNFMLSDNYSSSSISLNTTQIDSSHILKTNNAYYFTDLGIAKKLNHMSILLNKTDPELFDHLKKFNLDNVYFCHEWLILHFKRCFKDVKDFYRCFEMLCSHFIELHTSALKNTSAKVLYSFDLFICLSLIQRIRNDLLNKCKSDMDIFEAFRQENNKNFFAENFELTVKNAEKIFEKYCVKSTDEIEQEKKVIVQNSSVSFKSMFKFNS